MTVIREVVFRFSSRRLQFGNLQHAHYMLHFHVLSKQKREFSDTNLEIKTFSWNVGRVFQSQT